VAQATFFNHFQSKQAVLAEMTREVFDRLEELIEEQAAREVSTEARIAGFTRRMAEEIAGAQGLARDVLLELMRSSGRAGQPIPYLALAKGPFARMMQEGQGRGDVRGDIEAAFLAEMIIGALNIVITNWMADTDYALEERLEQTANFLAEALAPRPRS